MARGREEVIVVRGMGRDLLLDFSLHAVEGLM